MKTVGELIFEIESGFCGDLVPPEGYLLSEYNRMACELSMLLPTSDARVVARAVDGRLDCTLSPRQIRRVFLGERELLRGSAALLHLLPRGRVYVPTEDGILACGEGDFTVFYRSVPTPLTAIAAESEPVDEGTLFYKLQRTHLEREAYLYIGDYSAADKRAAEFDSLLADYKAENGVRE